ncbi:MAG: tRNA/tmRNA/rRNA uracil-C5-methylase, partial [Propionibacteriales bacterium]
MNIELRLDDWASHGNVVARHESRVVFVRGGLPGELVTAEVTDDSKAHFWRARVVEVLEPSPDRIEPTCPSADSCGGCDFQHA